MSEDEAMSGPACETCELLKRGRDEVYWKIERCDKCGHWYRVFSGAVFNVGDEHYICCCIPNRRHLVIAGWYDILLDRDGAASRPSRCSTCGGIVGRELGPLPYLDAQIAEQARQAWRLMPCPTCRPDAAATWEASIGGCTSCGGIGYVNPPPKPDDSIKNAVLRWQLWGSRCPECVPERRARCPTCYGKMEAGVCVWCGPHSAGPLDDEHKES